MDARADIGPARVDIASALRGGLGVFAARDFAAGEFIARFEGTETAQRTRMSLQFGPGRHVEPGENHPLRFLNHACEPNAAFGNGEGDRDLHALRDISAGTEITIDYNVHEDELSHPFKCSCGAAKCVETVRGGRFSDRF
jgi:SET domain-containing protein